MKKGFNSLLKAKKTLINLKFIEISKGANLDSKMSSFSNNPTIPYQVPNTGSSGI
jgi:hypothetical protein